MLGMDTAACNATPASVYGGGGEDDIRAWAASKLFSPTIGDKYPDGAADDDCPTSAGAVETWTGDGRVKLASAEENV